MSNTVLNRPQDLAWLCHAHLGELAILLRPLSNGLYPFVVAVLEGNEDCPTAIELYSEDRSNGPHLRLVRDGDVYRVAGVRQC